MRVAFQGEYGAYSHAAILMHFGDDAGVRPVPCRSFAELFAAVAVGEAEFGMVPVENSLGGAVTGINDLLLNHDFKASAEVLYPVRHYLVAAPPPAGSARADITHVRSHPQALEQCREYLARQGLVPVDWYDTAGAAKSLVEEPAPGTAALSSLIAADTWNLEIVDRDVADGPGNLTRFLLIGHETAERTEDCKTSVLFAVPDQPGGLVKALQVFSDRNINLTNISSFPRRNRRWNYVFFMEFLGHIEDPIVSEAVTQLLVNTAFLKLLGSFPRAPEPQDLSLGRIPGFGK